MPARRAVRLNLSGYGGRGHRAVFLRKTCDGTGRTTKATSAAIATRAHMLSSSPQPSPSERARGVTRRPMPGRQASGRVLASSRAAGRRRHARADLGTAERSSESCRGQR